MRYDWVIDQLLKEKTRYEARVRRILARAIGQDQVTADEIGKPRGPYKKRKKMSKKMREQISKRMKELHAAKRKKAGNN